MFIEIGRYVLYGVIALVAIGVLILMAVLLLQSQKDKKAREELEAQPQNDTLAEQIQKQFQEDDGRKERIIYNKTGLTKAKMKETRSAFSFESNDNDTGLTLESEFADDDKDQPFLNKNDQNRI